jgi:glycosyltransferase involved in cell wall biosynthesis
MESRQRFYDTILVSRAHNMELMRSKLGHPSEWSPGSRVIYDAEAITALREAGRRKVRGDCLSLEAMEALVTAEVNLARDVDAIIAVSESDRRAFLLHGTAPVHVVSHAFRLTPTRPTFEDRAGFLFIGSFDELSPNEDAIRWFAGDVLPLVRASLGTAVPLILVGRNPPQSVRRLQELGIELHGDVDDLTPFYERARVFVAPSRFAAGIPYKIGHAAAHGVPVVCTPLLRIQLAWTQGVELLEGETPHEFARACVALYSDPQQWFAIRRGALDRLATEYSFERFRSNLRAALGLGTGTGL